MRILVIEDHALVREGLLLALQGLGEKGNPAETMGAGNADDAMRVLASNESVDLILLDLMLPGTSGKTLLSVIHKRFPHIPTVIVSAQDDGETVRKVMRQGAAGFISKASPTTVLLDALRRVLAGEIWLPHEYREEIGQRRPAKTMAERFGLTKSQLPVLDLLAEGKTNREIADLLNITEGTVKVHVSGIFKAMNVSNRSQALLLARGKR